MQPLGNSQVVCKRCGGSVRMTEVNGKFAVSRAEWTKMLFGLLERHHDRAHSSDEKVIGFVHYDGYESIEDMSYAARGIIYKRVPAERVQYKSPHPSKAKIQVKREHE